MRRPVRSIGLRLALGAALAAASALFAGAAAAAPATTNPGRAPEALGDLVRAHCTRCHDGSSTLDLRTLPGPADRAVWSAMLERLRDQTMPPPGTRTVAERFPLDPATRAELIAGIEARIGRSADLAPSPRFLSPRAWEAIVRRLAGPSVAGDRLDAALAPVFRVFPSNTRRFRRMSAMLQARVDQASWLVCADLAAAPGWLPARDAPGDRAAAVRRLELALFAGADPAAIARGLARYRRLSRAAGDRAEAWSALCATYLSGPRLWYGAFEHGAPGRAETEASP